MKVGFAPSDTHKSPALLLAIRLQRLCRPVKVPIALPVSVLLTILLIHAFEMPSVADAYTPYKKNKAIKTYKLLLIAKPAYTTENINKPVKNIFFNPNLSAKIPIGYANKTNTRL